MDTTTSSSYSSPSFSRLLPIEARSKSLKSSESIRISEVYSSDQSLASILNNPHLGKDSTWGSWFFSGSADNLDSSTPLPLKALPEVTRSDFKPYLDSILDAYNKFSDVREHSNWEQSNRLSIAGESLQSQLPAQGEGLAACLREIPPLYFSDDFALEDGSTFQAACPYSSIPQNMMLQEKLSHYLDVVEVHLVNEISARSDSFFEAQGQLEDLNHRILQTCEQIRELKLKVQLLNVDVIEAACNIQCMSQQRDNLLALQQKLKLMSYVKQALNALDLLVAAADCGGALDVIDDLQHLMEGNDLVGLHCFRHLGDRLASAMTAVNSMLAADFVRVAIHDTKDLEPSVILAKFKKRDLTLITTSKDIGFVQSTYKEDEDETNIHDQLLALVIGLLRTSKLPAVLKVYRETLITDIKAAIKSVVAEILPVLYTRPLESDLQYTDRQADIEVGGASLASKLRSFSAQSFVLLLAAVFEIVQVRLLRAAEVRRVIEQIIGGLQGSYAAAAVAAAFASGAAAAAAAEAAQVDKQLSFHSSQALKTSQQYDNFLMKEIEAPSPTSISTNFRADVLRENTEAVCAACEAAHDRWAKLLSVRAPVNPKLRLLEFVNIFNISQDFMSATKKVGGRYTSSIQIPLQSQSKAFIDFQHSNRMSKITAALEQELWVAADTDEYQAIVDSFSEVEATNNGVSGIDHLTDGYDEKQDQIEGDISNSQLVEGSSMPDKSSNFVTRPEKESISDGSGVRLAKLEEQEYGREDTSTASEMHAKDHDSSFYADKPVVNGTGQRAGIHSQESVTEAPARSKRGREKPSSKTLLIQGVRFYMVNSGLILLKMLSEYIEISTLLPTLSSDVLHRITEILKVFNSRTCQLVLGAGAMQVSGLKSISAKHLALASECISFFHTLIPEIRRLLSIHISDTRKSLLLTELDRVAQDYKVHRDEIHSKLVQIMKERMTLHLRMLPQLVEDWNRSDDQDSQPSQFARALTKEVGILHRVLTPLLSDADVQFIFTYVVELVHSHLTEDFSKLKLNSLTAKKKLYTDIQHILACIRTLPTNLRESNGTQKPGELDAFLEQNFRADLIG